MKYAIAAKLVALLLITAVMILPAVSASRYDSDYTNKYEPAVIERCDGTGTLYVTVACHHTLISSEFTIQRVEQTGIEKLTYGVPLTEGNLKYLKNLGDPITRHLDASGKSDERFVPGDFLITLTDGNAGQKEYQLARIAPCENSYVNFLGHAVSFGGVCKITIVKATYGMHECHQVVDVPAHTHYRYRKAALCCNPLNKPWTEWSNTDDAPQWVPCCNKQTNHVEATYKTVCSGEYATVTSEVQSVIDGGHSSFLFNNAKNPGGIFTPDGLTLLSGITDPAPGLVKDVHIVYNTGSGSPDHIIKTEEYAEITISCGGGEQTCGLRGCDKLS
jgi:hypothetical protein